MEFIKPKRLRPGDTVAVLSPSWGGPSRYPHVFDLGLEKLRERFGLNIKEFPTARMDADEVYRNPQVRAEDINTAFADPSVAGIITSIGGDDSVRILPYLSLDVILANPKVFTGYSDTTAINLYLNSKGLVTYNGPSVMAGYAQFAHLPASACDFVRGVLFGDERSYLPSSLWTDRYVEWTTPGYSGEVEPLRPKEGWRVVQGQGAVEGRLVGGCIEVFEFLKGTPFWPSPDYFRDAILFFETSEEKPTVDNVKYMLRNYGSMGVLEHVRALLLGRARSYTDLEKAELEYVAARVVGLEFGRKDMPILANMDFGHTDPQWVLPLGVRARVDCGKPSFTLLESATNPA